MHKLMTKQPFIKKIGELFNNKAVYISYKSGYIFNLRVGNAIVIKNKNK
jgi:hypothetical protein